ncbi:MAG TPA: LytR C-terminal domain-containing protein [Baekduia sp.]|uniref:LytR C-terminal domain-containing protein n=1 Tax=Baekduia sp. TaxID=2600305 RepID=UPI002D790339|nr:LytR C-terminal domain-containing protein [Baekduia sp.]HET6508913.1 LytR C-terminal domain-containing protein [Baekduia sp.]
MSSILAFSVSDKIEQYGAYAGFASVLGLAVLSLLYFAQAREVKRLREWAGRSPERAAEQQERAVAAAQQQRVVAQPQRPGQPVPGQPGQPVRPAAATPAGQAAAAPAAAAAATAAGAAGAAAAAGATATQPPPAAGGQPTTAMPAANGAAAAATPPAARPGQPLRVPAGGPGGGAPGSGAARLQEPEDDEPRSRTGLFAAVGAILVVLVVGVVLVTGVLGGSDDKGTQPTTTVGENGAASGGASKSSTNKKKTTPAPSAPKPGTYEVAVLNGTTVPGLARGVANRLQNNKYKIGNVTNAATQDRSATLVEFAPGHRADADQVAKAIDVGADAIQPLSAGSKTIAGDTATVVVTVGSDQNVSPQSNGTATGTTGTTG